MLRMILRKKLTMMLKCAIMSTSQGKGWCKMRKSGRTYTPLTTEQLKAVKDYLETDMSYDEVAEKYGITKSALRYWVKQKYQREQQERDNNES